MPSGGKRENAGRKSISRDIKRVTLAIRLPPDIAEAVERLADDAGMSKGRLVECLVSWFIEDCEKEESEFSDQKRT